MSNTNPTWTGPGANPGLRVERLAANRLGHGMVYDGLYGGYVEIIAPSCDMLLELMGSYRMSENILWKVILLPMHKQCYVSLGINQHMR
jgi:hypothetical protein